MKRIKAVVTDLDGTLLRNNGSLSARTMRAIRSAEGAGLTVVAVTARPPRQVRAIAAAHGLGGVAVCSNGAILHDIGADRDLVHERLDALFARDLAETIRALRSGVIFAVERGHRIDYEPDFPPVSRDVCNGRPPRFDHIGRLGDEPLTKLLVHHPVIGADILGELVRAHIGTQAAVQHSGGGHFVEILAPGVSKESGLKSLCAHLAVDRSELIAFGDMPNDLPMLRYAGRSVAVANAHPEVLNAVDEITESNEDDGVARSIERLLAEMRESDEPRKRRRVSHLRADG